MCIKSISRVTGLDLSLISVYGLEARLHCYKTFEYSQLKYLSIQLVDQTIFSACTYLSMRLFSRQRIFSASYFADSNIRVENSLENMKKVYDGAGRW
jgi:hypothetical protein